MKQFYLLLCCFAILEIGFAQNSLQKPVIKVDIPTPTADKPQSKIWFMDSTWWALLPSKSGPTLWERTADGWITNAEVNNQLKGLQGRVDTYVDRNIVYAVGVNNYEISVFSLSKSSSRWKVNVLGNFTFKKNKHVETATISLDNVGNLWVSAIVGDEVTVWCKSGNKHWNKPYIIANGIGKDDICTIVTQDNLVRVIWSDQKNEAIMNCTHLNTKTYNEWESIEIVEKGNKTADDHLNTLVADDGTLYLVTKNSLDIVGKPQFVLRVLPVGGTWKNYPFCNLEATRQPTRPIIVGVKNKASDIFIGYSMFDDKEDNTGQILFAVMDLNSETVVAKTISVMNPDKQVWGKGNQINNVTGPKDLFAASTPWIVLASDKEGNVYEADLSIFF
ncbi:hypothetical protein [Neptunitalea lumnitzerae]|uniref:T9SS C-terminal target domain-containing protein n=1 Tax=Neptunitalea lumnitzerae TaxID=2965509 RepID=A0ABQ5MIY4_9FLAO|nr:hypothetical protein [Neptunitalea sp. Y10]GLB49349.1 hypothetical protein Y10_17170 [Neptunitalea sp. Y10]